MKQIHMRCSTAYSMWRNARTVAEDWKAGRPFTGECYELKLPMRTFTIHNEKELHEAGVTHLAIYYSTRNPPLLIPLKGKS